jgi:hypothetical protein
MKCEYLTIVPGNTPSAKAILYCLKGNHDCTGKECQECYIRGAKWLTYNDGKAMFE